MKIQFKKLVDHAWKPKFGKPGDAGADLVATSRDTSRFDEQQIVYGTGLAVEIPEGMVGLIFPRSSIRNYDLTMANSVGVIDSGYRGEIMVTFNIKLDSKIAHTILASDKFDELFDKYNLQPVNFYNVGDRIAQLVIMPVPLVQYTEVDELSETSRGEGGHGSTGK